METVKGSLEEARLESRNLDLTSVATVVLLLLSKGSLQVDFPSDYSIEVVRASLGLFLLSVKVAHASLGLFLLMDKALSPVLIPHSP